MRRGKVAEFLHYLSNRQVQLLPHLENLKKQRLYRPQRGGPDRYGNLQPILSRPIDWELIEQQHDEMVKFATALRLGTADAESILRRFTRNNVQHPTYRALTELGKALKTTFLCEYLRLEALRREIHEGLQVVETWNSANEFILYGKGGELASNSREEQEVLMLCLHLLQVSLVYVNTLMMQQVLAEPEWQGRLTTADLRGLTPLLWQHVNPYGTFRLDMNERLPLTFLPLSASRKTRMDHLLFCMPLSRHLSSFGFPSRGPYSAARFNFRLVSFSGFGSIRCCLLDSSRIDLPNTSTPRPCRS
jgi:hypothetical protein